MEQFPVKQVGLCNETVLSLHLSRVVDRDVTSRYYTISTVRILCSLYVRYDCKGNIKNLLTIL